MNKYLKYILILSLVLSFIINVGVVLAQDPPATTPNTAGSTNPPGGNTAGSTNPPKTIPTLTNPLTKTDSIGAVVEKAIEIFTYLMVMAAVVLLIIVGLKYIMARGSTDKMKEASKWLWNIIIGLAIVLGARLIVQIVLNTLEDTKVVNQQVIQNARKGAGI